MFKQWQWVAIVFIAFAGCSEVRYSGADAGSASKSVNSRVSKNGRTARKSRRASEKTEASDAGSLPLDLNRKLIYVADVSLAVKDFSALEKDIQSAVQESSGIVENSSIERQSGKRTTGTWKVRIPVKFFHAFIEEVASLGEEEGKSQNAEDVTEEYVDLEARIKNQKKLEERIVQLLETQSDELKEVLAVERELARVRGDIERMEGRMRFLNDRIELTTVTIRAREVRDYKPPTAATFSSRVTLAWENAIAALQRFGENAVVTIVRAGPATLVAVILGLPFLLYLRRRWRKWRAK